MSFLRLRRKLEDDLIRDATNDCSTDCDKNSNAQGFCQQSCVYVCPEICQYVEVPLSPPNRDGHQKSKRISIIAASVLASAVLLVCLLALYLNSRRRRRSIGARSRSSRLVVRTNDDQFLDEDHGPIIDHPIWHIRTIGLQPSVISSIKVFRYRRKGDGGGGLVEGTDCSVCLSEFQEDETLRLLPKCNHAFHLPCIDTWLRSHTTCPLCRSPIVVNEGARLTQSSSSIGVMNNNNRQNPDEIRLAIPEEDEEETEREVERDEEEVEGESCEDNDDVSYNIEEAEVQRVRRSVSMDSLSALRISQAVTDEAKEKESNLREQCNGKIMRKLVGSGSSSFLKRSVSCSGKFFLPRYS